MHPFSKLTLLALITLTGASAFAQPAAIAKGEPHPRGMREHRETPFKDALNLDKTQHEAWRTYQKALTPMNKEALKTLPTPERIDQRAAHMAERNDATKLFYLTLTAEQKKIFDDKTMPRRPRH